MANPKSMMVFQPGDRIGFIGNPQEITAVEKLVSQADTPG
jgi:Trk K+ transport system NAD-binding subunit